MKKGRELYLRPRPLKYTSVSAHGRTTPKAKKEEKFTRCCADKHAELPKKNIEIQ
jgi:hypothetical protein